MKHLLALLTIFVAQSALAGTCLINTTETYIYTGGVIPFAQVVTPAFGPADCLQKGQNTANFVYSANIQSSVQVTTTTQFIDNYGRYFPRMVSYGQYIVLTPQFETMYPYLLVGDAYLGLWGAYHYRTYNRYPVGVYYNRPEVRVHYQTRTVRETRIVEHRTTYERNRTTQTTRTTTVQQQGHQSHQSQNCQQHGNCQHGRN